MGRVLPVILPKPYRLKRLTYGISTFDSVEMKVDFSLISTINKISGSAKF